MVRMALMPETAAVTAQFERLGVRGNDLAWSIGATHRTALIRRLNNLNNSVVMGHLVSADGGELVPPPSFLRISVAPKVLIWFAGSRRLQVEETSVVAEGAVVLSTEQEEPDGSQAEVSTRKQEKMAERLATFVGRLAKHQGTCGQLATTVLLSAGTAEEGRARKALQEDRKASQLRIGRELMETTISRRCLRKASAPSRCGSHRGMSCFLKPESFVRCSNKSLRHMFDVSIAVLRIKECIAPRTFLIIIRILSN